MRLLLLAAAAVSLITLVASGPASSVSTAAPPCSKTTAAQLVNQYHLNNFLLPQPVGQLLCGQFAGPGSQAMAVGIAAATCWPVQGWALFSVVNGTWQLVINPDFVFLFPLVAVGSDIREITPVARPSDPRCIPSGGAKARLWHWNGSTLVASPWKKIRTEADFYSPSRNLACEMDDYRGDLPSQVYCQSWKVPHNVRLHPNGSLRKCAGQRCLGNPGEHTPKLAYGKSVAVGRFRCTSRRVGVECVVISSGKGFLIDSKGSRRFTAGKAAALMRARG
jgi:hypothetical protein